MNWSWWPIYPRIKQIFSKLPDLFAFLSKIWLQIILDFYISQVSQDFLQTLSAIPRPFPHLFFKTWQIVGNKSVHSSCLLSFLKISSPAASIISFSSSEIKGLQYTDCVNIRRNPKSWKKQFIDGIRFQYVKICHNFVHL